MSVPAEKLSTLPASRLCEARIKGRIIGHRRFIGQTGVTHLTLIVIPSEDEYTSPQTVEVSSQQKIGEKGDDINILVKVGGFRRQYKTTDKETGEQITVTSADTRLTVINNDAR